MIERSVTVPDAVLLTIARLRRQRGTSNPTGQGGALRFLTRVEELSVLASAWGGPCSGLTVKHVVSVRSLSAAELRPLAL